MPYVLLGQGSFEIDPRVTPPGAETVMVPQATTLQCMTADQGLFLGPGAPGLWEQLTSPWALLDCGAEVPNLALYRLDAVWEAAAQFDGHTLVQPGIGNHPDPLLLCADTTGRCPSTREQVEEGLAHSCEGVFGRLHGEEVYWISASAAFAWGGEPVVGYLPPVGAEAGAERSPVFAEGSLQAFAEDTLGAFLASDRAALAEANGGVLRAAVPGRVVPCVISGTAFAIGAAVEHSVFSPDPEDQTPCLLSVIANDDRTDHHAPEGWLVLSDVPQDKQGVVTAELARCSPYAVTFR